MTSKEIILKVMEKTGTAKGDLAKAFGMTSAAIWARLDTRRTDNLTAKSMEEMLNHMGYRIAVVPMSEKVQPGWYTMSGECDEQEGDEPTDESTPEEQETLGLREEIRKMIREELAAMTPTPVSSQP